MKKPLAKQIFTLQEKTQLSFFLQCITKDFSLFQYHQAEVSQKQGLLNTLTVGASSETPFICNKAVTLKVRLEEINKEEATLLAKIEQLKIERSSLLSQRETT